MLDVGVFETLILPFLFFFFSFLSSFSSRTFLNNMKAFGLENDVCSEFLQKMSTIGELSEGKRDLEGLG